MTFPSLSRRLIFFWTPLADTNINIPEWLKENINQWQFHNPNMIVEVINDSDIQDLLAKTDQDLCTLYSQITIPACKSDIARLLWLYTYGGMYVDVHTACQCNVDDLLELTSIYNLIIPFHPEHLQSPKTFPYPLRSGVLIARKGGAFLQELLEAVKRNLLNLKRCQERGQSYQYHISDITGPHFIAETLQHEVECQNALAHCYVCAQMGNSIDKHKIKLIDIEKYVYWHKFSSYRMEDGQYSASHWTVLQTQKKLFEL